ncbi:MAG: hypothetical protein QM736_03735 [Vicinamibacterales bacterium]
MKPCSRCVAKKVTAWRGSTADSTTGCSSSQRIPSPASTTNHNTITGPKSPPTRCVPCF